MLNTQRYALLSVLMLKNYFIDPHNLPIKKLFDHFDRTYGFATYQQRLVYLECSCHGLVWMGGVFAFLYLLPSWMELWSNLLLLIFLDIVVVAVVKVISCL